MLTKMCVHTDFGNDFINIVFVHRSFKFANFLHWQVTVTCETRLYNALVILALARTITLSAPTPNAFCCSCHRSVCAPEQNGATWRCSRMHQTVASRRLLRGSARTNLFVERVGRRRYEVDVRLCAVLQPDPVSLGRLNRHRHELDVCLCAFL